MYVYIYIYIHTHTHSTQVYTYVRVYLICMCIFIHTHTHTHTTHTTHTHQSRTTRTQDQGSRERNWTGRRRRSSVDGEKPHRAKETYYRGKRDLLIGLRSFRAHRGSQVAHSQKWAKVCPLVVFYSEYPGQWLFEKIGWGISVSLNSSSSFKRPTPWLGRMAPEVPHSQELYVVNILGHWLLSIWAAETLAIVCSSILTTKSIFTVYSSCPFGLQRRWRSYVLVYLLQKVYLLHTALVHLRCRDAGDRVS